MKERPSQPESQGVRPEEVLTIAWMLACICTAVAMLVVVALSLIAAIFPTPQGSHPLYGIAAVLLFLAMVTGTLCLAFTMLVMRTRTISPPRAITIAAVIIGIAPFIGLAVLRYGGR